MTTDERYMRQALQLARGGVGRTAPNPAVGCVIVQQNRVVGLGVTAPAGRPHAETQALAQAGAAARGACAYVTLEPCAHTGKTPPCAQSLINAGVARVVYAAHDPDPRVAGQGAAMLRAAGIEVVAQVGEAQARAVNCGFLSRLERARPWVTLKVAVSLDGRIAAAPATRTAISGSMAFAYTQQLRAANDAIVVGSGTIVGDNPQLTCRGLGLSAQSPTRVVLDRRLRTPLHSTVVQTAAQVPTWLYTAHAAPQHSALAVQVHTGDWHLPQVLQHLASAGINNVLVEGGGTLSGALLQQQLVDELILFVAPQVLGAGGVSFIDIALQQNFAIIEQCLLQSDTLLRLRSL